MIAWYVCFTPWLIIAIKLRFLPFFLNITNGAALGTQSLSIYMFIIDKNNKVLLHLLRANHKN